MSAASESLRERHVRCGRIQARVWEKGSGEPLLFLAGIGGLTRWTPCLDALAATRRVIVPSLPGQPGGLGHDELDSVLDWITATLDLIDAVGALGIDWVGVSIGGTLAAEAAAASRGCRRLALLSPLGVYCPDDPVTDVFCQPPGALAGLLCSQPTSRAYFTPDSSDPIEAQVLVARASEAAARLLWPTTDTGLSRRLHRIIAPTLLMRGSEDAVLPASYLARIADGIGGPTELATLPGAGHLADLDAPREVAGRLLGFLG